MVAPIFPRNNHESTYFFCTGFKTMQSLAPIWVLCFKRSVKSTV